MILDLTTTTRLSTASTGDGALFVHDAGKGCILVLPMDLDALAEDVRIAIALRDAE